MVMVPSALGKGPAREIFLLPKDLLPKSALLDMAEAMP